MINNTIFILMRFSVFNASGFALQRSASSPAEYAAKLFAPARLKDKLALFEKIAARSVMNQLPSPANIHFVIMTSDALPEEYRQELHRVVEKVKKSSGVECAVLNVRSKLETAQQFDVLYPDISQAVDGYLSDYFRDKDQQAFATVRLDDDDAIAASFCQRLSSYLVRRVTGFPISFAQGYEAYYDVSSETFNRVKHWNYPKNAQGLAFTNWYTREKGYQDSRVHVYRLGVHTKIDQRDPVIIDSRNGSFIRVLSDHNDSGGFKFHDFLPDAQRCDFEFDEFGFLGTFDLVDGEIRRSIEEKIKLGSYAAAEKRFQLSRGKR